jgi:hypothetical protein
METFENRERGFENAFAHDEELGFRVRMGSLRRLGRWADETLNSEAPDRDADALVARALDGADDEALLADLARDLNGLGVSAHRIRSRLATFAQEAAREVHEGRQSGANHSTTRT